MLLFGHHIRGLRQPFAFDLNVSQTHWVVLCLLSSKEVPNFDVFEHGKASIRWVDGRLFLFGERPCLAQCEDAVARPGAQRHGFAKGNLASPSIEAQSKPGELKVSKGQSQP